MRLTRRKMFGLPAVLFADAPKVSRLDVFPVTYPVTGHFRFFPKPERPTLLVKLTAEDGTVGWGQSVPIPAWSYETPIESLAAIRELLAFYPDRVSIEIGGGAGR